MFGKKMVMVGVLTVARLGEIASGGTVGSNWDISSGAQRLEDGLYAWGQIGGTSLNADFLATSGNLTWYTEESSEPGGEPALYFTLVVSSGGPATPPTEDGYLSAGGQFHRNTVEVIGSDENLTFHFEEALRLYWNGDLTFQAGNDWGGSSYGNLYASVITNATSLRADPQLDLNEWVGPGEEPPWLNGHQENIWFFGAVDPSRYRVTAGVVPEPASWVLMALSGLGGGAATFYRRRAT